MLDLFGKGYVIEHCISLFKKDQADETYRIFVTELLSCIAQGLGGQVNTRYIDVIRPKEEKSAEEIINHIKEGLS